MWVKVKEKKKKKTSKSNISSLLVFINFTSPEYMAVTKYRSKYPVIHANPRLMLVIKNFNKNDYITMLGLTGISFPIGYYISPMKKIHTASYAALFGALAGLFMGIRNSAYRFLGIFPNQDLVKKYPYRLDYYDYQVRTEPFREIVEEELMEIEDSPRY